LRGAHSSPIHKICLGRCAPCALLSNRSLRFSSASNKLKILKLPRRGEMSQF
jgi:hypothetical protein